MKAMHNHSIIMTLEGQIICSQSPMHRLNHLNMMLNDEWPKFQLIHRKKNNDKDASIAKT